MQREVVKLQHELAAQKLAVVNVTKVQSDLSNAEKVAGFPTVNCRTYIA